MLPESIQLDVVTPERRVVSEAVDEVILPSVDGYMGVRPGHAPLLARLDVGELSYRRGGRTRRFAVAGGFAEVLRDRVHVLAETCESADEIDVERAQRARERAESQLKEKLSESEFKQAEIGLKKALSRIQVQRAVHPPS